MSLWCSYGYYYYAGAIFVTTLVSLSMTVYETRKLQRMLRDRVHGNEMVEVVRDGNKVETISSEMLVPGDIIHIPQHGCEVMCDAVVVDGTAIVDEAALTGESVPVVKAAIPDGGGPFTMKAYQRHILHSGTKVLQTRPSEKGHPVTAVVLRTGFATSKGALIRSIMFPKPVDFTFYRHTYYFIGLLASIAFCGMIYSAILRTMRGQNVSEIIIRSLDVITIAVPPALPAALSVGVVYAQRRLKQSRIFCLSPRAINVCGSINLVCFDKTGTLTQEGLELKCVVPSVNGDFTEALEHPADLPDSFLKFCMVACHSLTILQGKLSGDPVDLIMFNATGWTLDDSDETVEESATRFGLMASAIMSHGKETLGIVRDFPFSSDLQRMSTVVRRIGDDHFIYLAKGAPEKIITLCQIESIPEDFQEQLDVFTQRGSRVLAVAWKSLQDMKFDKIAKIKREELDVGLFFAGFIVMENRLKSDTPTVLKELQQANIRCIMVTGDNMHTAISVARECGMVKETDDVQMVTANADVTHWSHSHKVASDDLQFQILTAPQAAPSSTVINLPYQHLAVSGESFGAIRTQQPEVLKKLLATGTVFARMSPVDKERLVEELQKAGFYVAMCGDGANDVGALKAAHTGVSLSESEAAAAAPFTACTGSIECVPHVLKEGRAALVTSFGIFKYMAGYSLAQFFTVILLYSIGTNLSDLQFLYIDFFQVLILSAAFGRSKAYTRLARRPPPTSLIAFVPLFSVFSQVFLACGTQLAVFFMAYSEKDNTSYEIMYPNHSGSPPFYSKENFAVFTVSTFQYIWLAVAFAKGLPYRQRLYKNKIFCLCAAVMIGFNLMMLLGPTAPIRGVLELLPPESWNKRLIYLGIVVANAVVALLFEKIVIDFLIFGKLSEKYKWLQTSVTHQAVEKSLLANKDEAWWNGMEGLGRVVSAPTLATMQKVASPPGIPAYPSNLSPSRSPRDVSYSNAAFVGENLQT
ncbi:hypothetical protein RvY_06915 [Ramazzottius varieornatus]|uniref:P-type ATPase A domain-containing protein n=1 Tax=Ramazzottius varieornatus TaxID=947166 RepID=A0A1D1V093_RAMVA|nr:hypothetical protein RvY_06915 [Ramazzottius varieornatus]